MLKFLNKHSPFLIVVGSVELLPFPRMVLPFSRLLGRGKTNTLPSRKNLRNEASEDILVLAEALLLPHLPCSAELVCEFSVTGPPKSWDERGSGGHLPHSLPKTLIPLRLLLLGLTPAPGQGLAPACAGDGEGECIINAESIQIRGVRGTSSYESSYDYSINYSVTIRPSYKGNESFWLDRADGFLMRREKKLNPKFVNVNKNGNTNGNTLKHLVDKTCSHVTFYFIGNFVCRHFRKKKKKSSFLTMYAHACLVLLW